MTVKDGAKVAQWFKRCENGVFFAALVGDTMARKKVLSKELVVEYCEARKVEGATRAELFRLLGLSKSPYSCGLLDEFVNEGVIVGVLDASRLPARWRFFSPKYVPAGIDDEQN